MPLSNVETARIFRTLTGHTSDPTSAQQLKELLNDNDLYISAAVLEVLNSSPYGDEVRKFRGQGQEVTAVSPVQGKRNTFVANLRFFSGPTNRPHQTLEYAVTLHDPQYDSFRGTLGYATSNATKIGRPAAKLHSSPCSP